MDKEALDEFEKFLLAMAKLMKHALRKSPAFAQYMCKEFQKLDELAFDSMGKKDGSMHRRAVMQHPFKCDHKQCKELAKFMISTGFDKMWHPSYGVMLDQQNKEDKKGKEELR